MYIPFNICLLLFLLLPSLAKSQENAKAVFLSINKQASAIDNLLGQMSNSLKKDRHKEMLQQSREMEGALEAIEKLANGLPLENSDKIFGLIKAFKTDLAGLNKLVQKGGFLDKDKALATPFASLKSRQEALRGYLRNAYSALIAAPPATKIPPSPLPTDSLQNSKAALPVVSGSLPVVNDLPSANLQESAPQVLAGMRQEKDRIATLIDSLAVAVKKNNAGKIRNLCKSIGGAAAKIEDLSLLLKDAQKDNIKTLAAGLKQYAGKLQQPAAKGHAAHEQLHELLELIETRFSVLSTGIAILK